MIYRLMKDKWLNSNFINRANHLVVGFFILAGFPMNAWAQNWKIARSQIVYFLDHPFNKVEGISASAKGRGECLDEHCQFLVETEVKSFDSGNKLRESHMIKAVKGVEFPVIEAQAAAALLSMNASIKTDLNIKFSGVKKLIRDVEFLVTKMSDGNVRVQGVIALKLSDFGIKPPSLLMVKASDDVPVKVDIEWVQQ